MKRITRFCLTLILLFILLLSLYKIGFYAKDYFIGRSDYNDASDLFQLSGELEFDSDEFEANISASIPEERDIEARFDYVEQYFSGCNFDALYDLNDEICGWIVIPGTKISYPLVQADNNDYYLNHTYNHSQNRVGSIFLDYRISNQFDGFNTIIYGHRMKDGSMFGDLKQYQNKETWQAQPYIFIKTEEHTYMYTIYSVFTGDPDGLSYDIDCNTAEEKEAYIDYTLSCSFYDTGVVPTTDDQFITLSTCTGSGHEERLIVHGVLKWWK